MGSEKKKKVKKEKQAKPEKAKVTTRKPRTKKRPKKKTIKKKIVIRKEPNYSRLRIEKLFDDKRIEKEIKDSNKKRKRKSKCIVEPSSKINKDLDVGMKFELFWEPTQSWSSSEIKWNWNDGSYVIQCEDDINDTPLTYYTNQYKYRYDVDLDDDESEKSKLPPKKKRKLSKSKKSKKSKKKHKKSKEKKSKKKKKKKKS